MRVINVVLLFFSLLMRRRGIMHGMNFYIYMYMYLFFLADAPATYCEWNKLVYQDRRVVGKKCVLLTFCLF